MGTSKYYQFYPSLQSYELKEWNIFITRMLDDYGYIIEETDTAYVIQKGEHPSIPKNGMLFRSLSSKISCCKEIESIMDGIAEILSEIFPNRVHIASCENDYADFVYSYDEIYSTYFTPMIPQTKEEFIKLLTSYTEYPARLKADLAWFTSH